MVLPPVRQGIILRQYGYVHHGRVEGNVYSREPRTSTGWAPVYWRPKLQITEATNTLGLTGVWYNVMK